jgi:hypothetical protein
MLILPVINKILNAELRAAVLTNHLRCSLAKNTTQQGLVPECPEATVKSIQLFPFHSLSFGFILPRARALSPVRASRQQAVYFLLLRRHKAT